MSTQREWTTIREYEDILFDYYNGIARITINRERYRNAFTPTTTAEMSDALRICREEADIDVIVITGAGDKVCILGDMFELGENEKQLHYEVGSYLAQKQIDVLLTVGALSTSIAQGAKDYRKNHAGAYPCSVHTFTTKEELIVQLPALLKQGDNILVKASHAMEFPKVIEAITEMTQE